MTETKKLDGAALISEACEKYYHADKEPGSPAKLRKKLLSFANDQKPSTRDMIEAGKNVARLIDGRRQLFKKACNRISQDRLGFDIFDDEDTYEVDHLQWIDEDPAAFVMRRFGSDFERLATQEDERRGEPDDEEAPDNDEEVPHGGEEAD